MTFHFLLGFISAHRKSAGPHPAGEERQADECDTERQRNKQHAEAQLAQVSGMLCLCDGNQFS
jgi:hypothetical protein